VLAGPERADVGSELAARECVRLAQEQRAARRRARAGTVFLMTVGASLGGAATGALSTYSWSDAGRGAAAGALGFGALGLAVASWLTLADAGSSYRSHVDRCLGERGYAVEGWE
jgi:hypothetical protein